MYDPTVIHALQTLREASTHPSMGGMLQQAITTLDNAGVFQEIDEQTGYDVLEFERDSLPDMDSDYRV